MAWVANVLESEFFWGVLVGILLTVIGSYFLAVFQASQQRQERKNILKSFCIDTVTNIRQTIDDMDNTRAKASMIHHDYLTLLDVEIDVFGRNREQLIYLPQAVRDEVRRYVTDCAIRRAEIGNRLTTFYNRWTLADQMESQGNAFHMQVRNAASNSPLAQAHKALDALVLRARDSDGVVKEITNVK